MGRRFLVIVLSGLAGGFAWTAWSTPVRAAAPSPGIFSASGNRLASFPLVPAGSSLAVGDINADGQSEIVVGTQPGVRTAITIYALDGTELKTFPVFSAKSTAGVNVAVGDIFGNGYQNIVVALRRGTGPQVLTYAWDGRKLGPGFYAYARNFRGGVNLATGDVDGNGSDEIITAPGPGGGAHVNAFRPDGVIVAKVFPYDRSFRSGLAITAFDYNQDGRDDIVTAPQTGRRAIVTIFDALERRLITSFPVLGSFSGGVSLAANRLGPTPKLLVGAGAGGAPQVVQYDPYTGAVSGISSYPLNTRWRGGVVAAPVDVDSDGTVEYAAVTGALTLPTERLAQYAAAVPTSTILGANYEQRRLATAVGLFTVDIVTGDLSTPGMRITTLTATSADCLDDCPVHPLQYYVDQVGGFAGMNGSYFCPADTSSCADQSGSTFWMWFNSLTQTAVNEYQNQFNTGPLVAFDTDNQPHLYTESKLFPGLAGFAVQRGVTLQALFSNDPWLVLDGAYAVDQNRLDAKQRTTKAIRGGVGMRGSTVYFFHAKNATVPDLGRVADALGLDWAVNLDGGSSSALSFDGVYRIGPGRSLPNAIVLTNH